MAFMQDVETAIGPRDFESSTLGLRSEFHKVSYAIRYSGSQSTRFWTEAIVYHFAK
ncbi:MAG: hypothetical protein ACE361_09665 [Aureliella sp.]